MRAVNMKVFGGRWVGGKGVVDEDALVAHDAIRIDRGTVFGNPYHIGRDGDRATVVAKYKRWFWQQLRNPEFRAAALALKGHNLACWCAPQQCHGDVIIAWFAAGCPIPEDR